MSNRILIRPEFGGVDTGDGGVRRVVEAQRKWLPDFGWEVVEDPQAADMLTGHIVLEDSMRPLIDSGRWPYVAQVHGLYWADYEWPAWALRSNAGVTANMRIADAVTAPSEWVAHAIRRGMAADVRVMYHGVDLDEWQPDPEPLGYVLWNKTRIDPVCDPHDMEQVAAKLPEVTFVSTFVRGNNVGGNIRVTGRLAHEQAKSLVSKAGAYLVTSRETFGIGTLEAMAAGVPIVGYAWGGQREIIEQGVQGILVEPGNIGALQEAITEVLANRARMGEAARELVRARFQWRDRVGDYARLFDEVLAGWKAARDPEVPRTSVIITHYRMPQYLPRAVQSVINQTDPSLEVVVVDDASNTPEADEVLRKVAASDKRVRVVKRQQNGYLAAARNTGISVARGRYILPLDADDEIAPTTVQLLADALDTTKSIAIAYGGCEFYEEADGRRIESNWPQDFNWRGQMSQRNQLPYCSMYRRAVWERTGGYRTRCRTAEDADFWCRVTSYGFDARKVTDATTLIYHNRQDSMSHSIALTDYATWYPWARDFAKTPFGAVGASERPESGWAVGSFEFPRIGVVIPCGPGHRSLLMDAIDSVDAQTYRNWEVVVVNDSGKPLPLLPGWVRVVETAGGVGVAEARNLGIAATTAPLLVFLDADDYLQPDYMEKTLRIYRERDGYAVVYTDQWTERGDKIEAAEAFNWEPQRGGQLLRRAVHGVTALYERSALQEVGLFTPTDGFEDWDLQLKLAAAGKCSIRLPVPLWNYRLYSGQRRETLLAGKDQHISEITNRYADYYDGGKELMACRSCGGRPNVVATTTQQLARQQSLPPGDFVAVRYTGPMLGGFALKGDQTGQLYYFSASQGENVRLVRRADVPGVIAKTHFELDATEQQADVVVVPEAPAVVASGPPLNGAEHRERHSGFDAFTEASPEPASPVVNTMIINQVSMSAPVAEPEPAPAPASDILPVPESAKRKPGRPRKAAQ